MKVTFLIATMMPGGAERVASILCNAWVDMGHEVDLLTYQSEKMPVRYRLDDRIRHHPLDLLIQNKDNLGFFTGNILRISTIRKKLKDIQPDIVISFMTETNIVGTLAAHNMGFPIIISERIHPAAHKIGLFRSLLRRIVYPLTNAVVVQTRDIEQWFERNIKIKSVVIPNPIDLMDYAQKFNGPRGVQPGEHQIVSVGRLDPQKGFDLLINAFSSLVDKHPDWSLTIFGEGDCRRALQNLISDLGLADRITLPGNVSNIPEHLQQADLFVFPSRYEGFPNALVEALASGMCVVATDCPGATSEILQNGKYGLIARNEDIHDLNAQMDKAMSDEDLRKQYSARARDAVAHLNKQNIAEQWIDLLHGTIEGDS